MGLLDSIFHDSSSVTTEINSTYMEDNKQKEILYHFSFKTPICKKFTCASFCIIIARYNENVEWSKQFPNVIIYNKGKNLDNSYNEVLLNNVGREGHTYYKYICDNYENLAEYTIFLQGRPFDHSPNIISNLTRYIDNKELRIDFEFLSERIHYSSLELERRKNWHCNNIHKNWERVFGVNSNNQECIFGAGAQFIVSKNKILKNTKEFYENIIKMLEYDIDPLEGYDIERFHKYIFI